MRGGRANRPTPQGYVRSGARGRSWFATGDSLRCQSAPGLRGGCCSRRGYLPRCSMPWWPPELCPLGAALTPPYELTRTLSPPFVLDLVKAHLMTRKEAASPASASFRLSLPAKPTLDGGGKTAREAWVSSVHLAGKGLDAREPAKAFDGTLKARAMTLLLPAAKIIPTGGPLSRSGSYLC